jgi:hypothetical protein
MAPTSSNGAIERSVEWLQIKRAQISHMERPERVKGEIIKPSGANAIIVFLWSSRLRWRYRTTTNLDRKMSRPPSRKITL